MFVKSRCWPWLKGRGLLWKTWIYTNVRSVGGDKITGYMFYRNVICKEMIIGVIIRGDNKACKFYIPRLWVNDNFDRGYSLFFSCI